MVRYGLLSLLLVLTVSGIGINQAFADVDFTIDQVATNSLLGDTSGFKPFNTASDVINDNIECKVKQTTQILDGNGNTLATLNSGGIFGSPIFQTSSFLSTDGSRALGQFNVIPKIFCQLSAGHPTIIIEDSTLQLRILAKEVGTTGSQVTTHIQNVVTNRADFSTSGDLEKAIATFFVPAGKVAEDLANKNVQYELEFRVTGTLDVTVNGLVTYPMTIPIKTTDLRTYYTASVTENIPQAVCQAGQIQVGGTCTSPTQESCAFNEVFVNGQCLPISSDSPTDPTIETQSTCEAKGGIWLVTTQFIFPNFVTSTSCVIPEVDESFIPVSTTDPDSDGDGIPDSVDLCDFAKETVNGFEDTDGCPDKVLDPAIKDTDGDGVSDVNDACPNARETFNDFEDLDGCPDIAPTNECVEGKVKVNGVCVDIGTLETTPKELYDLILTGKVITKVSIAFEDQTKEVFFPTGTGTVGNIVTNTGTLGTVEIQTNEIVGGFGGGVKPKPISLITLETFYTVDPSKASQLSIIGSDISYIPTVIESSVSKAELSNIGSKLPTTRSIVQLENGLYGASIGIGSISAENIALVASALGITEGGSRDADIRFDVQGTIDFKHVSDLTQSVRVNNNFVKINDFLITNEKTPVAPVNCEKVGQVPKDFDPITGEPISCKDPTDDPNSATCLTVERPQGFKCDETWQNANCSSSSATAQGEVFSCTEPDDDGDGIPNVNDSCVDKPEDGDSRGNISDGCPFEGTAIETHICPDGRELPVGKSCDEVTCSGLACLPPAPPVDICIAPLSTVEGCDPNDIPLNTGLLILVGAVMSIVAVVIIIFARRR